MTRDSALPDDDKSVPADAAGIVSAYKDTAGEWKETAVEVRLKGYRPEREVIRLGETREQALRFELEPAPSK